MNDYKEVKKCRCCNSKVFTILNLNDQPLANSYHKIDDELKDFPLKLNLCKKCFHLQLSIVVNPDLMFKNYLYVSGTTYTLKEYFDFFSRFTIERFKNYFNQNPSKVLDIACNDGTQLNFYKKRGLKTYGIDPAENLFHISSKEHKIICDYFPSNKIKNKFNLIIAQNVFAHTDTINTFLDGAKKLLAKNGILYIQTSQANMIKNNEFDTIYHEHLSFFNSLSMKTIVEKHKLNLNNVYKFDIHGTSYVFEISNIKHDNNLDSILKLEKSSGLYNLKTYEKFSKNAIFITKKLQKEILKYKNLGYKIIGYGAAAKGMTLINFAKINMDYIIDDNILKHNLYTPGMNIPIKDIGIINSSNFNKILFVPLAWNFYKEIYKKIKTIRDNKNDLFIKYFPNISIKK